MKIKIISVLFIAFAIYILMELFNNSNHRESNIKGSDIKVITEANFSESKDNDCLEGVKLKNEEKFIHLLKISHLYDDVKDWGPFWNTGAEAITIWAVIKPKTICYRIDIPINNELPCEVTFYWPKNKSSKFIKQEDVKDQIRFIESVLQEPLEFLESSLEEANSNTKLRATFIVQKIEDNEYSWAVRPNCRLFQTKGDSSRMFKLLKEFIRLSDLPELKSATF